MMTRRRARSPRALAVAVTVVLLGACAPVLGRTGALIASALAFSLIHQGFASLVPMFGLGLLFGAIRLSGKGSLYGAIVAHAFFNALTLALLFAIGGSGVLWRRAP